MAGLGAHPCSLPISWKKTHLQVLRQTQRVLLREAVKLQLYLILTTDSSIRKTGQMFLTHSIIEEIVLHWPNPYSDIVVTGVKVLEGDSVHFACLIGY